jgi:hypothetical protein
VALAVVVALGVAVVGGVRSFEAVSVRFGSVLVPLTADGMILACTALRLAALTRGWRLPGSLLVTYGFIIGTVALNVTAAHGWADAVAHALARFPMPCWSRCWRTCCGCTCGWPSRPGRGWAF